MAREYFQIGGAVAVKIIAEAYAKRLVTNKDLKGFYLKEGVEEAANFQNNLLVYLLGGPMNQSTKVLNERFEKLSKLGLQNRHLLIIFQELSRTLEGLGISDEIIHHIESMWMATLEVKIGISSDELLNNEPVAKLI